MIHESVSPRTVGLARILVYGAWIVTVWQLPIGDLAALPPEAFVRPGVLRLVPEPLFASCLDAQVLQGLRIALLGLLAWLVLGLRPFQPVALATCVVITLFDGLTKSLGYLNHGETNLLYAAYALALFPCAEGAALSPAPSRSSAASRSAALLTVAVLLTASYSFIAAYRLDSAGPGLFASDSMGAYILRRSLEHNAYGFTWGLELVRQPILFAAVKLGFGLVTALELTAPLALFWRPYRWLWMAVMLGFHLLTWLLMNILFWQNLVLILFFLTDRGRPSIRVDGRPDRPRSWTSEEAPIASGTSPG